MIFSGSKNSKDEFQDCVGKSCFAEFDNLTAALLQRLVNTDGVYRMIELQRRLAQDYQRQREAELNRHMAQTAIRDNDQTMLARRAEVERYGNGLPPLHQTDRGHVANHGDQLHPRSGQHTGASWPQSDVTGGGPYGDKSRQQVDRVKAVPVGHGSAPVDDFVQQLKSRHAK